MGLLRMRPCESGEAPRALAWRSRVDAKQDLSDIAYLFHLVQELALIGPHKFSTLSPQARMRFLGPTAVTVTCARKRSIHIYS
jgi:hypothetical protein